MKKRRLPSWAWWWRRRRCPSRCAPRASRPSGSQSSSPAPYWRLQTARPQGEMLDDTIQPVAFPFALIPIMLCYAMNTVAMTRRRDVSISPRSLCLPNICEIYRRPFRSPFILTGSTGGCPPAAPLEGSTTYGFASLASSTSLHNHKTTS
jgi:hypothetical protein